jgi:hypothetical protein
MDVISLLRDSDPASRQQVPDPDSFIGHSIWSEVTGRGATGTTRRIRPQRRMPRGFPVATALVFALTIGLLLTLVYTTSSGPKSIPTPRAVKALDHLATLAAKQPATASGRYYYTDIENVNTQSSSSTFSANILSIQQTWIEANGDAVQATTVLRYPQFYTSADRKAWIKAGRPPVATPPFGSLQRYSATTPGVPPLYDVKGLPLDPASLYKILNRENRGAVGYGKLPKGISELDYQGSCNSAACSLFERDAALMQGPDIGMTPAFRSSLFKVLAMVPNIKYLGTVPDPIGQSGTGFRFVDSTPAQTEYYTCRPEVISPKPIRGAKDVKQFRFPASSVTYTLVVNPRTSLLMSQEQTYLPFFKQENGPGQTCLSETQPGTLIKDQRPQESLPIFDVLRQSGVVDSIPKSVVGSSR